MEIIVGETRLIRTYGACPAELATIPPIAAYHDITVYQGVNLGTDDAANDAEIACYGDLAAANANIAAGMIGGEALHFGWLTEAELTGYLNQARTVAALPVTTGEPWNDWCLEADAKPRCQGRPDLAAAVDFITAHTHPYWEGLPVEHAVPHVVATYLLLRDLYPGKEVRIGETGWPSCGDPTGNAVPGAENQPRFTEELWDWSQRYGVPALYFEAFDEPWKAVNEGAVGACWGLYNGDRTPKYPDLDWSLPIAPPPPTGPAVRIEHPAGSTETTTKPNCAIPIVGRAYSARAGWHVRVEVFTDAWYVQDKWYAGGLAPIVDGAWAMPEIYLAGQGAYNNHGISATPVDDTGAAVASDAVTGIVRTNDCAP